MPITNCSDKCLQFNYFVKYSDRSQLILSVGSLSLSLRPVCFSQGEPSANNARKLRIPDKPERSQKRGVRPEINKNNSGRIYLLS